MWSWYSAEPRYAQIVKCEKSGCMHMALTAYRQGHFRSFAVNICKIIKRGEYNRGRKYTRNRKRCYVGNIRMPISRSSCWQVEAYRNETAIK